MVLHDGPLPTLGIEEPAGGRRWHWTDSLAMALPGRRYRLLDVRSSIARDRCHALGFEVGDVLECAGNRAGVVVLERADGRRITLERDLAWFIGAETPERETVRGN